MSAKYKSPSFLLPNELNTSANPANDTGINSLYSMDFDGSSDYIDLGDSDSLSFGDSSTDSPFSISAWIYMNDATNFRILNKYNAPNYEYQFDLSSSDKLQFYIFDGSNYRGVGYDSALSINQWYHVVATYDGRGESSAQSGMVLYVNGSPVNDITYSSGSYTAMHNTTAPVNIGRIASSYANGKIDEVAIFNRALNTAEIAALYGGTSPDIYPSNLMATDLNPVAYYPLGEQAQMQGYLGNEASSEWQFPNGVLQDYVMDFDGTDNVNSEANISSVSSFTASIWINRDDSATQYIYGQWVDGTTASQSWVVQTVGGIVYFNVRDASLSVKSAISTTSLTTGIWYNIIAVWTGSNIKLYINNSLEDTTACSSMNNPSTAVKLAIGSSSNNVSPFNGKISNAVIWNSDQEANRANIYNNGSPQTTYTVAPQNWWKLNADSVYTPSAPNYTTALDFDGSSNYIDLNFQSQTTPATISIWVNTDVNDSQQRYAIINGRADQQPTVYLRMQTDNTYQVFISNTNGSDTLQGSSATINTWFHFSIVCENSQTLLYENGVLKDSSSIGWNGIDIDQSNNWQLGRDSRGQRYWNGKLSNAAVFNSALTPSQISTLFNFGTPETNISFSPQAWWKLDNTTTGIQDSSGNGNNGTNNGATDISSGVAVTPSWKIPSALPIPTVNYTTALDFDSSQSDYIDLGTTTDYDTGDLSVAIWVNISNTGGTQYIFSNSGSPSIKGFDIKVRQSNQIGVSRSSQLKSSTSGWVNVGFEYDVWQHLAFTFNYATNTIKLFLNGELKDTSIGITESTSIASNKLTIGSYKGVQSYTNGKLSNAAIFNSTLIDQQIESIYNSGTPETAISFSPVGWWKLDTGGSTITDYGSGGNNGTNNGAAQVISDVYSENIPVNGVSTTLPSTALQQSDLQFDSPYSNYSLSFDQGSSDYVNCGEITELQNASVITWNCWVNFDIANFNIVFGKHLTTTNDAIQFYTWSSGVGYFWLKTAGSSFTATINPFIGSLVNLNEWNMFSIVFDGTQTGNDRLKIYLNGGSTNIITSYSATPPATLPNTTDDFYIGRGTNGYFDGKIDEFSIFNYGLTSAQVLEIYNNGRPKDLTTFSGTAPISWWRLGENAYFNTGTTPGPEFTVPNSISGAPNGTGSGTITTMISADAPGTYANGIGANLDILDRVGDAPLSTSNSQSYNMIPDDKVPYVPGYVGLQTNNIYSMSFDAASNTSFNATISALDNATALTFSGWFKKTINNVVGFESFVSSTDRIILYWWSDNNVYWSVRNGSASSTASSALTIYDWNHVVGTFDGATNTIKLYINGSLVDTETGQPSSTSANLSNNFHIGLSNGNTYNNGQIDEVTIWDTALNAGQIFNDLYQPTATATNKTADLVNNPNLPTPVAWYRMGD